MRSFVHEVHGLITWIHEICPVFGDDCSKYLGALSCFFVAVKNDNAGSDDVTSIRYDSMSIGSDDNTVGDDVSMTIGSDDSTVGSDGSTVGGDCETTFNKNMAEMETYDAAKNESSSNVSTAFQQAKLAGGNHDTVANDKLNNYTSMSSASRTILATNDANSLRTL
ncbi:hypothetical protein VdG2_06661 [Verticillium dahliae VDG2]|nr:hypothetical protein VdG2_06661 [Verticillium dahliae VDG2]